jgi:hypothetical protein
MIETIKRVMDVINVNPQHIWNALINPVFVLLGKEKIRVILFLAVHHRATLCAKIKCARLKKVKVRTNVVKILSAVSTPNVKIVLVYSLMTRPLPQKIYVT